MFQVHFLGVEVPVSIFPIQGWPPGLSIRGIPIYSCMGAAGSRGVESLPVDGSLFYVTLVGTGNLVLEPITLANITG